MDAGERGPKRHSWAKGHAGLPIAMSSITTSAIDTPQRRSMERTCDDLAILVLAAVAFVASLTFRDYGLGWDDYTHAEYADLLLRMYGSGFKDTGALSFANLYMYGGGFDMAAALLHKVIPLELFETRRLLGADRRRDRPCGDLAAWPARRRPARRTRRAAAAGAVPDLLRAHVHEPEGCAIRRGDGDPDAGPCPAGRGISAAFAADHPDRRAWRRPVDRFAHSRRARADLRAGRLHAAVRGGDPHPGRARSRPTLPACRSTCCCPA